MPDVGHPLLFPTSRDGAVPVAEALRSLPLEAPPRSVWPAVAPKPARPPRWPYAFATAAALALALLLPVPPDGGSAGNADINAAIDLPALMRESARLERLVADVGQDPLQPADALVIGLAYEDELSGVDAALAATAPGSREALDLWQQRVDILSRYAELQSSRRLLASAGQPFETTVVSLY